MTTPITGSTPDITLSTTNVNDNLASSTNGEELVKQIKIDDSPFTILKWDDKYYLTLGKYRLTEALDTEDQARDEVENVSWWRLLQVMHIVAKEEINDTRYKNNGKP